MSRGPSKLNDVPEEWNRISEALIGAAMEVHTILGPGLLERLYEQALAHELERRGIPYQRQVPIRLRFKDIELEGQVLDFVVADLLVVELKSVERVHEVHLSQLYSYMRSARLPLGLLINFNVPHLKDGIFRRVLSRNTPVPSILLSQDLAPRPSAPSDTSAFS